MFNQEVTKVDWLLASKFQSFSNDVISRVGLILQADQKCRKKTQNFETLKTFVNLKRKTLRNIRKRWCRDRHIFQQKKNLVSIELFRQLSTTRTMTYMYQERGKSGLRCYFNPTTPMSDQDRISPNNINAISSKQVMRIKKSINHVTISGSNTNTEFFKKNHHNQTVGRITSEILEWES